MRLPVEASGPDHLIARAKIEQSHGDPEPVAIALDCSIQEKIDPERAANRRFIARLRHEPSEGTARNHEQPTESGQCGGDLVSESGRKVRLLLRRPYELQR